VAWTTAQRDALQAAIARGVQTVTFNGRTTTYQSLRDMRDLLAEMNRELGGATTQAYRLAAVSKGV